MSENNQANPLSLDQLKSAVAGNAAAFRCRRKLQPGGGAGDKVFPPTSMPGPSMPSNSAISRLPPFVPAVL